MGPPQKRPASASEAARKRPAAASSPRAAPARREIRTVGFLGISDYGLAQLEVLADRYAVAFATAKAKSVQHADALTGDLARLCEKRGIEYLGAVDANSEEIVARARKTDLLVIGGYDAILRGPILEAARHGVLNTHLGLLPQNRGCCPTMWAQLHGVGQGYTTYLVNRKIDFGAVLDRFEADPGLGGLRDNNRRVYDSLAGSAASRFAAALDRFERGDELAPCAGTNAYHRKGMPNDAWLSFHWSHAFLRRFSLALDFAPYLPGRTRVEGEDEDLFLSVESEVVGAAPAEGPPPAVGTVLAAAGSGLIFVWAREGVLRCRVVKGATPAVGATLRSVGGAGAHPIDELFAGDALSLDRYLM